MPNLIKSLLMSQTTTRSSNHCLEVYKKYYKESLWTWYFRLMAMLNYNNVEHLPVSPEYIPTTKVYFFFRFSTLKISYRALLVVPSQSESSTRNS